MQTNTTTQENTKQSYIAKRKLYVLSLIMAAITLVLGIIGWKILLESSLSLNYISQKVLPATVVAEKITATGVQLNAEVPDVLNARDQAELSAKYANLVKFIGKQAAFLKELDNIPHNNELSKELVNLIEKAMDKLAMVNDNMSNILWTKDLENKFSIKLRDVNNQFILQITKLADDALFTLVTSNKAADNNTQAGTPTNQAEKVNDGNMGKDLTILNTLLEIKAEGILIAGIMETTVNHLNIDEIALLQERFMTASSKLQEHLKILTIYDAIKFKDLNLMATDLITLGQGNDNCFSLRDTELRFANKISVVAKDLKPIGNKIEDVEKSLLIDILKNIDALNGLKTQYNKLMLVFGCVFVFFTLMLGTCLYLIHKITIHSSTMKCSNIKENVQAFSLVELMVVIAIIGILSAVAVPSYKNYIIKSRIVEVLTVMESYKLSVINIYNATGAFPISGATPTGISTNYLSELDHGNANNQNIWIRGWVSANVGLPASQQYIIMLVQASNDIINTYCGQWLSDGTYVDLQYLPSSCQGTNIRDLEYH